jgi:hypothetical protein
MSGRMTLAQAEHMADTLTRLDRMQQAAALAVTPRQHKMFLDAANVLRREVASMVKVPRLNAS